MIEFFKSLLWNPPIMRGDIFEFKGPNPFGRKTGHKVEIIKVNKKMIVYKWLYGDWPNQIKSMEPSNFRYCYKKCKERK